MTRDVTLADCFLNAAGIAAVVIERDLTVRPVDVVTVAKPDNGIMLFCRVQRRPIFV
jgi:hypothetical protein